MRDSLVTLIGDVAAYYGEARGYQARIALAERTAVSQRDTEKLTRSKYDAGSGNAVDLAKATAQAASTEANVRPIRQRSRLTSIDWASCSGSRLTGSLRCWRSPRPFLHRACRCSDFRPISS